MRQLRATALLIAVIFAGVALSEGALVAAERPLGHFQWLHGDHPFAVVLLTAVNEREAENNAIQGLGDTIEQCQ